MRLPSSVGAALISNSHLPHPCHYCPITVDCRASERRLAKKIWEVLVQEVNFYGFLFVLWSVLALFLLFLGTCRVHFRPPAVFNRLHSLALEQVCMKIEEFSGSRRFNSCCHSYFFWFLYCASYFSAPLMCVPCNPSASLPCCRAVLLQIVGSYGMKVALVQLL